MAAAVFLLLTAVASPARAQTGDTSAADTGRFRFGPIRFTPSLTITNLGVDDNVFNEFENPKRDMTAAVGPAAAFWVRLGRSRITGKSAGQYLFFKDNENQRSWNFMDEGRWELPMARVTPFLTGNYTNSRERPGYEIDSRARRHDESYGVGTELRVSGKTTIAVSGRHARVEFDQKETFLGAQLATALNRRSDEAEMQLRYKMTRLTTFVLTGEAMRDRFVYDPLRDSDSVRVLSGFELKPRALISGKALVGYRHFNAVDSRVPDYQGLVASVDAKYTVSATQFAVKVARDLMYSFEPTQPYYALLDVGVAVTERVTRSWDVVGRGGWQTLGYKSLAAPLPTGDRVDTGRQLGGGIGYRLGRTVRLGFDVERYRRVSQAGAFRNYDGLRFGGSVTYGSPP